MSDLLAVAWWIVTHRSCDPFACCADDSAVEAGELTKLARKALAPILFPIPMAPHAYGLSEAERVQLREVLADAYGTASVLSAHVSSTPAELAAWDAALGRKP